MSADISVLTASLVAALEDDPFYVAITADFADDPDKRREILAHYFEYSMAEGERLGRCTVLPGSDDGVAVWLRPNPPEVEAAAHAAKAEFLSRTLGRRGVENYQRIVAFMTPHAKRAVNADAWYLSIIGVSPAAQGKGLGRRLLEPMLHEADGVGAACYLETFGPQAMRFYERLGFTPVASHVEPVTALPYWIMVRTPFIPSYQ